MASRANDPITIPGSLWQRAETLTALRARDIGRLFQLISQYTGASQTQIGIACGFSQGKISFIMRHLAYVEELDVFHRIADGLNMPDQARITLGLAPRRLPPAQNSPSQSAQREEPILLEIGQEAFAEVSKEGDQVDRRRFGTTAMGLLAGTLIPPPRISGTVDSETCEGLTNMMLGYRQVYRSASAASLLAPVRGTLKLLTELAPESGRYCDAIVSLIGQAAALAGAIVMFDLDDFATAKEYLTISARAAQQSADAELMAIVLGCRAFHATYSGDPGTGLEFAQGALKVAARGIHPRSHGWVAAVASEMHAALGPDEEAACMAALDVAESQLARLMPAQAWAGIGAFDEGKLAAYRGGDLMRLGNYAGARVQLEAALDKLSPALAKHRCTAHIDLAEAYAYDDEPGQAAGHAVSALEIISCTQHADSLRRVEGIYGAIKRSGTHEARDLGVRLLEFKATS